MSIVTGAVSAILTLMTRPFLVHHRDHMGAALKREGLIGEGVEVGVYAGQNAHTILSTWPGVLHGVDPYAQLPGWVDACNQVDLLKVRGVAEQLLGQFGKRFQLHPISSAAAAPQFRDGQLDFVYLDGNHSRDAVLYDIVAWWPKIKPGGIMGGHDFYERHDKDQDCGVPEAVIGFYMREQVSFTVTPCTSWWVRKP